LSVSFAFENLVRAIDLLSLVVPGVSNNLLKQC
jgi:hypothetical protein